MSDLAADLLREWRRSARLWKGETDRWDAPGIVAYHPAIYGCAVYARFLKSFPPKPGPILALGLNPGPYGMAQTGIPFTDCRTATAALGIPLELPGTAPAALARKLRPAGRWRSTYERSSLGVYRFLRLAWGDLPSAYANWVPVNVCPVLFLGKGPWKNVTPADSRLRALDGFQELRRESLRGFHRAVRPRAIVCIGKDVSASLGPLAEELVGADRVIHHPHPARAVPEAWARALRAALARKRLL